MAGMQAWQSISWICRVRASKKLLAYVFVGAEAAPPAGDGIVLRATRLADAGRGKSRCHPHVCFVEGLNYMPCALQCGQHQGDIGDSSLCKSHVWPGSALS